MPLLLVQKQKATSLLAAVLAAQEPSSAALPETAARAAAFEQAISSFVYDLLIAKVTLDYKASASRLGPMLIFQAWAQVRAGFAGVARMEVWRAAEPESAFNLPSFSTYPQVYPDAL